MRALALVVSVFSLSAVLGVPADMVDAQGRVRDRVEKRKAERESEKKDGIPGTETKDGDITDREKQPSARRTAYEVEVRADLAYVTGDDADKEKHKLDIYAPKGVESAPVLMFVHGGAWKSGDRKQYDDFGKRWAKLGFMTAVVSYRLTPAMAAKSALKHPDHVKDVARAFAWVKKNAKEYKGDAANLWIAGHSAGSHLAALLALDDQYLKAEGCAKSDIKGVLALSGVYSTEMVGRFADVFGDDAAGHAKAAPLGHVSDKQPPFLVCYADHDVPSMREDSAKLVEALEGKKSDVESFKAPDRNHISLIRQFGEAEDEATIKALAFIAVRGGAKPSAKPENEESELPSGSEEPENEAGPSNQDGTPAENTSPGESAGSSEEPEDF